MVVGLLQRGCCIVVIMSFNLYLPCPMDGAAKEERTLGKTCIFAAVGTCQLIDGGLKNTRVPDQSTVSICWSYPRLGDLRNTTTTILTSDDASFLFCKELGGT